MIRCARAILSFCLIAVFAQLVGCSNRIADEYDNPVLHLQASSYSLGASDSHAVEEKANLYAGVSNSFFKPYFKAERLTYPPKNLVMLVLKQEKEIQLYTHQGSGWRYIVSIRIRAASGHAGPKLKQGDKQVPEGIYRVVDFNPHSLFHLSMGLNYPNDFDVQRARAEGRDDLGDNIFIHGNAVSIGCIAIGDDGINVLFPLAVKLGVNSMVVIIAPRDFRLKAPVFSGSTNPWDRRLYVDLQRYMSLLPAPKHDDVIRFA